MTNFTSSSRHMSRSLEMKLPVKLGVVVQPTCFTLQVMVRPRVVSATAANVDPLYLLPSRVALGVGVRVWLNGVRLGIVLVLLLDDAVDGVCLEFDRAMRSSVLTQRLNALDRKRLVVDPFVREELVVRERFDRASLHRPAALIACDLFVLSRRRRDLFCSVRLAAGGGADVEVPIAVEISLFGAEDAVTSGECKSMNW